MSDHDTEIITYRQWDACARRIFNQNIKKQGRSLSETGIARRAHSFILDIRDDEKTMRVRKGWREAMRTEESDAS